MDDERLELLDPDSARFIEFVFQYLEDPETRQEFLLECRRKFQNFISRNPSEVNRLLKEKLIKGSLEHGEPGKYTQEQVDKELEAEFLDIIGWSMVGIWCKQKTPGSR